MILTLSHRYDESGSEVYAEDDDEEDSDVEEKAAARKCDMDVVLILVPYKFCM